MVGELSLCVFVVSGSALAWLVGGRTCPGCEVPHCGRFGWRRGVRGWAGVGKPWGKPKVEVFDGRGVPGRGGREEMALTGIAT